MAKKRGRKKKRGPKKKKIIPPRTYVGLKRPYHLLLMSNGNQLEDICNCTNYTIAHKKLIALQEQLNKDVKFPVKYISNRDVKKFVPASYTITMIKLRGLEDTGITGKVRDEYGRYVDCETGNDKWLFVEEVPYNVEESFWVYGYNPKVQRKDFTFIFDNLIRVKSNDKYYMKELVVYKNKLLISSVEKLDMVICKNHQDSVRLYNAIYEESKKCKMKYITLGGDVVKRSYSYNKWFNAIQSLTHWSAKKISKNTTRD